MNRQQRNMLIVAGGAVAYLAIKNSGPPTELIMAEANDLIMSNQASASPVKMDQEQFDRMVDDIVTVNGIVVILTPSNKLNKTDSYYVSPNASREELNLIISQVNNALRNKVQFSTVQEVTLKNIAAAAHRHLVRANVGDLKPNSPQTLGISLDGIF